MTTKEGIAHLGKFEHREDAKRNAGGGNSAKLTSGNWRRWSSVNWMDGKDRGAKMILDAAATEF